MLYVSHLSDSDCERLAGRLLANGGDMDGALEELGIFMIAERAWYHVGRWLNAMWPYGQDRFYPDGLGAGALMAARTHVVMAIIEDGYTNLLSRMMWQDCRRFYEIHYPWLRWDDENDDEELEHSDGAW